MKKKIYWLNPVQHNVYKGYLYFLNKYFLLFIYDVENNFYNNDIDFQHYNHNKLTLSRIISLKSNMLCFYDNCKINYNKNEDIVIVGDIFTNISSYTLKGKNIILYSEFFLNGKTLLKKIIFFIVGLLFFYNKRIIVPTKYAYNTFKKISKNVFYFPEIYYGPINKPLIKKDTILKILFVGRISQYFKNTDFLINNFLYLKSQGYKIELTLVGEVIDDDFYIKYGKYINDGSIRYVGKLYGEDLNTIYQNNDLLVLPSFNDPIGAVILEAMANGLAIISTDTIGGSGYIENNINGYIIETNNNKQFNEIIINLIENIEILTDLKYNSYDLVKNNYWYKNNDLMNKYLIEFNNFIK